MTKRKRGFDPYAELDIDPDASPKEIAAAAKRHAKKNHPDTGGDRNRFEAGRRALVVLKDPKKREQFDRTGSIDEEAVDNDMAAAMQLIIKEFADLINYYMAKPETERIHFDPRKIPVFERMKVALAKKAEEGRLSVKTAEGQIEFLRDVASRISITKKEGLPEVDFVKRALEDQIRGFEELIEKAKEGQRRHAIAVDLLAIYNFRFDAPQPVYAGNIMAGVIVQGWTTS